jgi:hypothetical protein
VAKLRELRGWERALSHIPQLRLIVAKTDRLEV